MKAHLMKRCNHDFLRRTLFHQGLNGRFSKLTSSHEMLIVWKIEPIRNWVLVKIQNMYWIEFATHFSSKYVSMCNENNCAMVQAII